MTHPSSHRPTEKATRPFGGSGILVTGASGRLGSELARRLAAPGTRLSLWGRDKQRLTEAAAECEAAGSSATVTVVDICDLNAALEALRREDDADPFDLVILVAGRGDTASEGQIVEDPLQIQQLGLTNFVAPATMAAEIAGRMVLRQHGQIGLIGSSAAFHSLPFAPGYCGSKAGLARFADALRLAVKQHGVTITLVSPGFIDDDGGTPLPKPRPWALTFPEAADRVIRALVTNKPHAIFPWQFAALRWLDRLLPRRVRDRLLLTLKSP